MLSDMLQRLRHRAAMRADARRYAGLSRRLASAGRTVSRADRRRAREYAREVFGNELFGAALTAYTACYGRFVEGWIPPLHFALAVERRLNQPIGLSRARILAARVLPAELLSDLVYIVDGCCYDTAYRRLADQQVTELLRNSQPELVLRPEWHDHGAPPPLRVASTLTAAELRAVPYRALLQRRPPPHPALLPFGDATLHLLSTRERDAGFRVRAAYLAANAANAAGSLECRVPLDLSSGEPAAEALTAQWQVVERAAGGTPFHTLRVPGLAAAIDAVLAIHRTLPHFVCLGWQLHIDADGRPWLSDWRTVGNEIAFLEAGLGPNFQGLNWERRADRT